MRHVSSVAFTSCELPLASGRKYVGIQLLTEEVLYFAVDVKGIGQDLFEQVCNSLKLSDTKWFGLALLIDGDYCFIDHTLKLSKYAPKAWKSLHGSGVSADNQALLHLHFRVQFYVDYHLLISDRVARHHYYLQLRENVLTYCLAHGEERAFQLAAYALQADLGNYGADKHIGRYFEPQKYFPPWIILKRGEDYIIQHAPAMHRDTAGIVRGEAHVMFIKESSDHTAAHNMHLYKMHRKKCKLYSVVWLGICFSGIEIFEDTGSIAKKHLSTFLWSDIVKLYFDKKKFEIHCAGCPEPRRFTYYARSEELAKSLLRLCKLTHQMNMFVQPQVQDLKRRESQDHKPYRESYIYSDSLDLAWEQGQRISSGHSNTLPDSVSLLKKTGGSSSEQRVSVISNASSNTTSGIVSDKVQSLDESEDDQDMEIMINSPPLHSGDDTAIRDLQLYSLTLEDCENREEENASSAGGSCTVLAATSDNCDTISSSVSSNHSVPSTRSSVGSYQKSLPYGAYTVNGIGIHTNSFSAIKSVNNVHDVTDHSVHSLRTQCQNVEKERLNGHQSIETSQDNKCRNNDIVYYPSAMASVTQYNQPPQFTVSDSHPARINGTNLHEINQLSQNIPFPWSHVRTATRIGVSSLTRVQRLPLTLFGRPPGIGPAGSEPNLSLLTMYPSSLPNYFNSSEMLSLPPCRNMIQRGRINSLDTLQQPHGHNPLLCNFSGNKAHNFIKVQANENHVLPCRNHSTEAIRAACIPRNHPPGPPPVTSLQASLTEDCVRQCQANRREGSCVLHQGSQANTFGEVNCNFKIPPMQCRERLGSLPVLTSNSAAHNGPSINSLDLQQLRQKSQDMDLPLISALCNDRSLLMLPKTVPTCSRQRHMGTNKDIRRYSCSAVGTRPISNGPQSLYCLQDMKKEIYNQGAPPSRPVSWHLEGINNQWWINKNLESNLYTNPQKNDIKLSSAYHCLPDTSSSLPPTILTSFSKSSDKSCTPNGKEIHSGQPRISNGHISRQILPMKLSNIGDLSVRERSQRCLVFPDFCGE